MNPFLSKPNPKRKPRIQKKLDKKDERWREIEACMRQEIFGTYPDDDEDDWEVMTGIDPDLGTYHA